MAFEMGLIHARLNGAMENLLLAIEEVAESNSPYLFKSDLGRQLLDVFANLEDATAKAYLLYEQSVMERLSERKSRSVKSANRSSDQQSVSSSPASGPEKLPDSKPGVDWSDYGRLFGESRSRIVEGQPGIQSFP